MDVGTLLILEGALVMLLVTARAACLRVLDLDSIPSVIRGRVALGNRVAPVVAALAAGAVLVGVVLSCWPG